MEREVWGSSIGQPYKPQMAIHINVGYVGWQGQRDNLRLLQTGGAPIPGCRLVYGMVFIK
jgi:hypothetical protein